MIHIVFNTADIAALEQAIELDDSLILMSGKSLLRFSKTKTETRQIICISIRLSGW